MLAAVACQKDPKPVNIVVPGVDDAGVLLANLVFTDEAKHITGYATGLALNEADPGEISIRCESPDEARALFRSWMPDGIDALDSGESLIWHMTDSAGVSQGSAVLKSGGPNGAVAHLELPAGFPAVSSVRFLPQSAMPENAELDFADALDMYYFGNILNVYPSDFSNGKAPHGSGLFCVIREYDQDTNTSGILLSMPDYEHKIDGIYVEEWDERVEKYLNQGRKLSELQGPIGKTYRKYRKYIDSKLSGGPYRQVSGDHWFACCKDGGGHGRYNLVTDESEGYMITSWWGWRWAPDFYDCQAYFFTLEKDGTGEYKVVYK